MEVLLALAARPGELVSRQTLLDEVWGDVVVLDENVTKAVQTLRKHLGDDPARPEFIRTVPRKGYELIAPVRPLTSDDSKEVDDRQGTRRDIPVPVPRRRRAWLVFGTAMSVLLIAVVVILAYQRYLNRESITLAVLPPDVTGESADLGFIGEGLVDHLIGQLSANRRLDVVARRSSFGIHDTDANVQAIGERLGARYLVEVSLRQNRDKLALTLSLADSEMGTNVWTATIEGSAEDVTMLQELSAQRLRDALRQSLGVTVALPTPGQHAIPDRAYRKYLEARYQWTLRGKRRIDRSIELLKEAIAIEPDYAAAHLALAQSVAVKPFYTDEPVDRQFEEARVSAQRALLLDPSLEADVEALEGFMLFREHRWLEARDSLREALTLAPDNVNALYWYSYFLSNIGRYDEALPYLLRAQKLDPISAVINDRLAIAYVWVGDLKHADERYRIATDLGYLDSTRPLAMSIFLIRAGRLDELADMLIHLGGDARWVEPTVAALAHPEQRASVGEIIDGITAPDPVLEMARFGIWMLIGDTDRAFRDFPSGPKSDYIEALWSAEAAHLRADPRFDKLLESLGFVGEERTLLPDYGNPGAFES